MWLVYNISVRFYGLLIYLVSLRNQKARQWVTGRRGMWEKLQQAIPDNRPLAWFHASSLGEFEQGRPLIEAFREEQPEMFILLTFFSPSGYRIHESYPGADFTCYIPLDTASNARRFVKCVQPRMAFFIKYDFWFNHLRILKQSGCRIFLVSAIFRPSQHFFRPWGGWFRKNLRFFEHFFIQTPASAALLQSIGYSNFTLSGDTRFDRVMHICQNTAGHAVVARFCDGAQVIVAGSTWPADEALLRQVYDTFPGMKLIIAPHEIHSTHIRQVMQLFPADVCCLSELFTETPVPDTRVMIIDSIGLLSGLYRYARLAYIGGGFGKGIHNTLEAACYGLPLFFGPNYHKFQEAVDLIDCGAAFPVTGNKELMDQLQSILEDEEAWKSAASAAVEYVKNRTGATLAVLNHLREK